MNINAFKHIFAIVLLLCSGVAFASTVSVTMRGANGNESVRLRVGATVYALSPSSSPITNYTQTYTATGVTLNDTIYVEFLVDNGDVYVDQITVDGTVIPYTSALENTGSWASGEGCGGPSNDGVLRCSGYMSFSPPVTTGDTVSVTMNSVNGYEWAYLRTGASIGSATTLTLSPSGQPVSASSATYTATGVTLGSYIYVDFPTDNGDIFVTKITVNGVDYPYSSAIENTASCGGANTGWLYCAGYMTFGSPSGSSSSSSSSSGAPTPSVRWHFDESAWDGTANEVKDSSVNSIDGVAVSSTAFPSTQDSSRALSGDPGTCGTGQFDGSSDGYVSIPDPGASSYLDQTSFTVSAWVYLNSLPTSGNYFTVLSKADNYEMHIDQNGTVLWQWNTTDPNAQWYGGWSSWVTVYSSSNVSAGGWHHIALATTVSSVQKIYIDGVLAGTSNNSRAPILNDTSLHIGTGQGGYVTSRAFNGYIDEVAIYDPELTISEVNAVMNERHECAPPVTPTPTLEWRFDESSWNGSADEVSEEQGSGLDGRAISLASYPTVQTTSPAPAIAGDPGTCHAGKFDTNDGYIRVDDPGVGSALDVTTYTISAWVYLNAWPSSGNFFTILSKESTYEIDIDSSGHAFVWWNTTNPNAGGSGISYLYLVSSNTIPVGEWHHITFSNAPGSQVVYVDAVPRVTGSSTATPLLDNNALYIGTDHAPYESSRRVNGYIDEVRLYNSQLSASEVGLVMNDTHACPPVVPPVNSITVDVGSGSGSTCSASEIEISILDSASNVVADYAGTITLSTSSGYGDWSKTGSAADAYGSLTPSGADSGAASYVFDASGTDLGVITLNLENAHSETVTISAYDASAGVTGTSSNLVFSENAFVVSSIDSLADDVVAGRRHDFQVVMKQRDPSTGVCSTAAGYSASAVKVWLNRAESAGAAPSLMRSDGSYSMTPPNSEPGANNFTLSFSSGVADFDLQTSDVGKYNIQFLDDSSGFSDVDISGASATFVVRPFAFYIDVASNPAANDHTGGVFTSAGTDFSVTVKAVAWQSADDIGDDGIADGHGDSDSSNNANLTDNSVLASFGAEASAEGVQLASVLVLPSAGFDPGLASSLILPADARKLESFGLGSDTTTRVYFDDVGIIEVSAAVLDGSYLGSAYTSKIVGRSGKVGRFTPGEFSMTAASMTESCSSFVNFTYLDKAFSVDFQLNALSARGSVTQNYESDFVKLNLGSGTLSFGALDQVGGANLTSRVSAGSSSFGWAAGAGGVSAALTLARDVSPDGPYPQTDIGVVATDSDGVTHRLVELDLDVEANGSDDYASIAQANFRYGRLRMKPAHGPETAQLPVELLTEYWDGSFWRENIDDSCTLLAQADISFPDGSIDNALNRTVAIDSSATVGSFSYVSGPDIGFSEGGAGHSFSAPGAGNTGSFNVDVDLTSYPWLRFDWDQDGSYSDTAIPTVTHTFGMYRGHDRIIYWREVLQ